MQLKPSEIGRFVHHFQPNFPVILLYGIDRGAIGYYAQKIAHNIQTFFGAPRSLYEINALDLTREPTKLIDQAITVPMFDNIQILSIDNAANQPNLLSALETLLQNRPEHCYLLLKAFDLKKGTKLHRLIEKASNAMAIACYHDNEAEIIQLAYNICAQYEITLQKEAAIALSQLLGSDRLYTCQEIEKLCLYVYPEKNIHLHHVEAVILDSTYKNFDHIVDNFLLGNKGKLYQALMSEFHYQTSIQPVFHLITRQLEQLQMIHYKVKNYALSKQEAIERLKPPVFYKRKTVLLEALKFWSPSLISRTLEHFYNLRLTMRQKSNIEKQIGIQELLKIADYIASLSKKLSLKNISER